MRRWTVTAFTAILCTLAASSLHARTFVITPGGNDGNAGTSAAPWRTLAKANSTLRAGDTVLVRAGTYHERIAPTSSGTAGAPLVYRAWPGEHVIIDGPDDNDLNLVALYGSWVIVEGFTFQNQDYFDLPGRRDYWIVIEGSNNTFRYNRVIAPGDVMQNIYTRNAASRGIAEAGRWNTIEHCYIRGLSFGIVIAGSSPRYTVLRYDTIHAIGQNCIDVGSTADGTTAYHGTLIEYCVLDTSFIEDNIQFEPDYGDPNTTLHNRGTIIRNTIMGNAAENAIDLKGAGHTIIENNLIYSSSGNDDGPLGGNDAGSGGGVSANPNNPTRYTIVRGNVIWDHVVGLEMAEGDHYFNNTILNNRRTWQGSNQTTGTHSALLAFNYPNFKRAFLNNIVGGQSGQYIFDWLMDWGGNFHLDNNLYYDGGAAVRFFHRLNGSRVTTTGLPEWKNTLATQGGYGYMRGKDGSSISADPIFVNAPIHPSGYDPAWSFRPGSGSPAIDAGTTVTTATAGGSNATTLTVDDSYFFCDGFGIVDGDAIMIGGGAPVRIASIDHGRHLITLSEPRSWAAGAGVHLAYNGSAPDIGAFESGSASTQPAIPSAIQLSSPTNGALDVALPPVLTWNSAGTALSYHIQVSSTSGFISPVVDQSGLTGTSFTPSGLSAATAYLWRVRGVNQAGAGPWSATRSFTTAAAAVSPAAVLLASPVNAATGISLTPTLAWNTVAGAASYQIQVSLSSTFGTTTIDQSGLTGTSFTAPSLSGSTTYYWRVRAINLSGAGPWSSTRSFTTATSSGGSDGAVTQIVRNGDFESGTGNWTFYSAGSGSAAAVTPGYNSTTAALVTLTAVADNMQFYQQAVPLKANTIYRLALAARSSGGRDMAVSVHRHTAPYTGYGLQSRVVPLIGAWRQFTIYFQTDNFTGTVTDGRLQFAFQGFARNGDQYWLDAVDIQESSPPPVPQATVVLSPSPAAEDQPTTVPINWQGEDGADGYRLQLSRDASFTSVVVDTFVVDTVARVGPLAAGTRYYRRVQTVNISGTGPFAAPAYFTTGAGSPEDPAKTGLPERIELDQNYPNPFNPATVIRFRLDATMSVTLKVYNLIGEEVVTLVDGEREGGEHMVTFGGSGLPSGVYFYQLRANGTIETRKMTLMR